MKLKLALTAEEADILHELIVQAADKSAVLDDKWLTEAGRKALQEAAILNPLEDRLHSLIHHARKTTRGGK